MTSQNQKQNQGEGDRKAADRYNKAQQEFIKKGGVEQAEDEHGEMTAQERAEAERAEQTGRARARETDPNVVREHTKAAQ